MKALLIDDQATARTLMRCILDSYGEIDEAGTGQDGLDLFRQAADGGTGYDLICVDLGLPDIDGMQVLDGIRSFETEHDGARAAKVFMITASTDPVDAARASQHKVDAYLQKPVSYASLMDAFEEAGIDPTSAS